MNQNELLAQLSDFLKRVQSAKVVLSDKDKQLIATVQRMLAPPFMVKARTPWELMVKVLDKDPNAPAHHRFIIADEKTIVAADNHRFAMVENTTGLKPGLYDRGENPVTHEGDIAPIVKMYREAYDDEFDNVLTVTRDQCAMVNSPTPDGKDIIQYVKVADRLNFHVQHFADFTNGEEQFKVYFNDSDKAEPCKIVNPKFPDMILIMVNLVL